ncbi:hypothetical protein Hte_007587 [Hypoxylon texense]
MANRGVSLDPNVFTIKDLQEAGSKKLPKPVRGKTPMIIGLTFAKVFAEYYNEGSMDMITLRDNEAVYNRYKIRPRILVNVSKIDTSTTIFGTKVSFPLGFAPAAMHKAAHPDGELATSRAAAKAGICMGLSTYSTYSLEDVIAQGKGNPYMFQFTLFQNREVALKILERVEAAGYKALVLTVDAPILGRRLNEYRNSFVPPEGTTFPNIDPDPKFSFVNASAQGLINGKVLSLLKSETPSQERLADIGSRRHCRLGVRHIVV